MIFIKNIYKIQYKKLVYNLIKINLLLKYFKMHLLQVFIVILIGGFFNPNLNKHNILFLIIIVKKIRNLLHKNQKGFILNF